MGEEKFKSQKKKKISMGDEKCKSQEKKKKKLGYIFTLVLKIYRIFETYCKIRDTYWKVGLEVKDKCGGGKM